MEKSQEPECNNDVSSAGERRSRGHYRFAILGSAVFLVVWHFFAGFGRSPPSSFHEPSSTSPGPIPIQHRFTWLQATAKPFLNYTDCFNGFQCARLEVPMDYWNSSTNATVGLAVIRQPAQVPITDERYGGAVLVNPGGPGGSGVGLVLLAGKGLATTIDTANSSVGKYFDIISFDPRGVGFTEPRVQCFATEANERVWAVRLLEEGLLESSDAALGRLWSMYTAMSQSCSLPQEDGGVDPKSYVSTASVARDMISIIEAHGEWREKEAEALLNPKLPYRHQNVLDSSRRWTPVPDSLRYKPGAEKLQYWGFSYGTYLGMTFSAMFPDRVERVIVDGVVDAVDYTATLWLDNLVDTEKALGMFYYYCARAGSPRCALANETGETTSEGVRNKVQAIQTRLYHNPLPVIGPDPNIITYSDVKEFIFDALYTPTRSFEYVAYVLNEIDGGNGHFMSQAQWSNNTKSVAFDPTGLEGFKAISYPPYNITNQDPSVPFRSSSKSLSDAGLGGASMAIACSDGDDQSFMDRAAFKKYWEALVTESPSFGSNWATWRLACARYSVRPNHRWTGPWEGNTAHPLLFIGNTADPVTPGRDAISMARGYRDAVTLLQDSPGHCSISAFSRCTTRYIKQYFQTGRLPPKGTKCPVDEVPFGKFMDEVPEYAAELEAKVLKNPQLARDLEAFRQIQNGLESVSTGLLGMAGGFSWPRRLEFYVHEEVRLNVKNERHPRH